MPAQAAAGATNNTVDDIARPELLTAHGTAPLCHTFPHYNNDTATLRYPTTLPQLGWFFGD